MPTIRDVADQAGVHPSTVSRVFSGRSKISESTRARVLETAEQLGFQPHAIARSLSKQQTHTIAIVVPHVFEGFFQGAFFPQVMQGLLQVAYKHDYRILVGGSSGHADEITQLIDIVGSRQADGIIVLSNRLDVDIVGALQNQDLPFVLMGKPAENRTEVAWVDSQDAYHSGEVVRYLVQLGHRRIAYVGGDPDVLVSNERSYGYKQALEEAGIEPMAEWIDYGFFAEDGGYQAVQRMSKLDQLAPTAYYAANDLMALGIIRALKQQNIRIPEQVSVVGTNNSTAAAYHCPALTSLKVPYVDMIAQAASLLLQSIKRGEMPKAQNSLDCQLIVRESTGPAPSA